jgi:hypothetical protein
MLSDLGPGTSISHIIEIPVLDLEFTLMDLLRILSEEELSLIGSPLESIFPYLGIVSRPIHCSIYSHDLLSSAVKLRTVETPLKAVFGSETSTKMSVIRQTCV